MTEYIYEEITDADGIDCYIKRGELIRCKNCEYYHPYYCEKWSKFGTLQTTEDGYCYLAERREE